MVQFTTTATLLTVAQVALYTAPALGGPIDLSGSQLDARSGVAGRIIKEMGKDHAMSKAQDLALQWKDQALNKNQPPKPSFAAAAQQALKEKKGKEPAAQAPKIPPMPPAPKKASIADQAKQAADAAKKHPVQAALKKQGRSLDFDLEERDFEELYELVARELYFDELEARSGVAGRIIKEMGKDHAMSKAQDLALQWKDQALNKNQPPKPSFAAAAQQALKEKKGKEPAVQAPKVPPMPPAPKKASIAEQAKQAAEAAKKHPVQAALKKQGRSLDFDLEARDFEEIYELVARELYFDELEARSGVAGKIIKEMGKDHAMSKAQDLALQWKDQALNKNQPPKPSIAAIAQQALKEKKKGKEPVPQVPKIPAMPPAPKKASIAEQAKQAAEVAKKHPVQAALKKQGRALDFDLEGRDIDELYNLVARDLYLDLLEARSMGSMSLYDLD